MSSDASNLTVRSSSGNYPVRIGHGILGKALEGIDALVLDEALKDSVDHDKSRTVLVRAGEQLKTLESCGGILAQLKDRGLTRSARLGACGGGSVQDAVTLSASLYMRGLSWEYYPSTAMSAMDSCIGGKSSINVGRFKNLAGNFYPPSKVLIDVDLLKELSPTALSSGLAEAVKICFAKGPDAFETFLTLAPQMGNRTDWAVTEDLVEFVLRQKVWFVEVDEFDKGERQLLNFGHTFAHALESATNYGIPHGVAVAYGVTAACLHPLSATTSLTQELMDYNRGLVSTSGVTPGNVKALIDPDRFLEALQNDKKGTQDSLVFILPTSSGALTQVVVPRGSHSAMQAMDCLFDALNQLEA